MSEQREEGACRCGKVRFAVSGPPLLTMACHCRGCRQMTASAFSLSSLYPADRFERVAGETELGGLKGATRHHFCPACMSWLYTQPEGFDGFVNVRSSLLDTAATHRPFVDLNAGEALGWAASGAIERYESEPDEEEFGGLIERFAAWDRVAAAPNTTIEGKG